jgi:hypothetical protein
MAGHRTELAGYDAMVGLARRLSMDTAAPAPSPVTADPAEAVPAGPGRDAAAVAPLGVEQVA